MKLYTQVHCRTISELSNTIKIMKALGWKSTGASKSDFILTFEKKKSHSDDHFPPKISFASLKEFFLGKTI